MRRREAIAWILAALLAAVIIIQFMSSRPRYEFRAGDNGVIVWRFHRISGRAWMARVGDPPNWHAVVEPTEDAIDFVPERR